jgi:hypothetical protein
LLNVQACNGIALLLNVQACNGIALLLKVQACNGIALLLNAYRKKSVSINITFLLNKESPLTNIYNEIQGC